MQVEVKKLAQELKSLEKRGRNLIKKHKSEVIPADQNVLALGAKLLLIKNLFDSRVKALENSGKKAETLKTEIKKPKHCISFCWSFMLLLIIWWTFYGFVTRVTNLIKCDCSPSL